jgi:hypothetical protein
VLGAETRLRINGSSVLAGGTHVALPLNSTLDRYEEHCGQPSEPPQLPAPSAAGAAPVPRDSLTFSRATEGGAGAILCFVAPGEKPISDTEFVPRVRSFLASEDLEDLGDARYIFAREAPAGGTDVVTVRMEGSFKLHDFMTRDDDVPGRDVPEIPRPPGSIRILDVEVDGTPYSLKSYKTQESPEVVLSRYDRSLTATGWGVVEIGDVPKATTRAFVKRGVGLIISVDHKEDAETRADLLVMGSRGSIHVLAGAEWAQP